MEQWNKNIWLTHEKGMLKTYYLNLSNRIFRGYSLPTLLFYRSIKL